MLFRSGWEGKLIPKEIIVSEYFKEEKSYIDKLNSDLTDLENELNEIIEETTSNETEEITALSEIVQDGKMKKKDVISKIDEIKEHIHTPLIDGLNSLLNLFPMKKKEYVEYVNEHENLMAAYTEKGTITKTSIKKAIEKAISEAMPPEGYENDYVDLKHVLDIIQKMDAIRLSPEE